MKGFFLWKTPPRFDKPSDSFTRIAFSPCIRMSTVPYRRGWMKGIDSKCSYYKLIWIICNDNGERKLPSNSPVRVGRPKYFLGNGDSCFLNISMCNLRAASFSDQVFQLSPLPVQSRQILLTLTAIRQHLVCFYAERGLPHPALTVGVG